MMRHARKRRQNQSCRFCHCYSSFLMETKRQRVLKQEPIKQDVFFFFVIRVLYLGWSNQPSSSKMENFYWKRSYAGNFLIVIPETT